ncbi:hypothetical protein ARAM_003605 [Aspergillus rambellii]|uniref:UmuC domain-containing protein n=1 Tax=Aspergillus rambellii TaxID=308745 RepID=A0A0F8UKJ0_9EURO|nr:hypothetical protein ARAM_003605 [Aspergillus rambellii]
MSSRNDSRIILHLDYDCFYASVFEVEQPALKLLPLAVQQKQIVVTCNYEARRRGLRKLQWIKEAKQVCPDVVIVLGEDLSRFRDASKDLSLFLRAFIWGDRVEKLGVDELFMDVTEMVSYNVDLLNPNDLEHSFFHLDRREPTAGFAFDATQIHGPTYPPGPSKTDLMCAQPQVAQLYRRLLLASHLAGYLRGQLEDQKGYTATVGVSTSKLLAKVVGTVHKPNSQTTLLPPYETAPNFEQSNVLRFLDSREIRAIPGIGSKLSQKLTAYLESTTGTAGADGKLTVRDDIGSRIWGLLHGVDNHAEIREARDLPTQISIENSYGRLDSFEAARKAMLSIAASLIRRMRADLTENHHETEDRPTDAAAEPTVRWLARPRTLRLSTNPRPSPGSSDGTHRISHSASLPQYVFTLDESVEGLAQRLVHECVTPLFRKLHQGRSGWNLRVLNLAVTNMVEVAGSRKHNSGQDIGRMFHRQSEPGEPVSVIGSRSLPQTHPAPADPAWEESGEDEEDMPVVSCVLCGAQIPHFARAAHELYHSTSGHSTGISSDPSRVLYA